MKKITYIFFIFLFSINFSQIRNDISSLNGEWEIIYDYNNIGKNNEYHLNKGFNTWVLVDSKLPDNEFYFNCAGKIW